MDADRYHEHNRGRWNPVRASVMDAIRRVNSVCTVDSILEIGCGEGRELATLVAEFGCSGLGLDASRKAIDHCFREYPEVSWKHGVAPQILSDLEDEEFDLVLVNFLQYLLPRGDIMWLAAAVDRILRPGGHLVVRDFMSPINLMKRYSHDSNLQVYKGQPSAVWMSDPRYALVERFTYHREICSSDLSDYANWETVDTLRKFEVSDVYAVASPRN